MALGFDKLRWETDLPTGTVISIIRGRGGWTQDADGTTVLSVADTVGQGAENLLPLAVAKWVTSPNVLVTLVATESSATGNVYHLSLAEAHDPAASLASETIFRSATHCELYIDQQSNLPVILDYNEYLSNWKHAVPVHLIFSDYRPVNGVHFPFKLSRYQASELVSETQLNSVVLNAPLSDDLFWVNQP